jgi:TIR domain-containing protein
VAYSYDIFISYKRHTETLVWIKKHFFPLLEHRVGLELGRDPTVYVHEVAQQIPAGSIWPQALAQSLAGSRILVALWTKSYFNSRWCTEELVHMLAREQHTACRSVANTFGLIVPVVIHDGRDFPQTLNYIEKLEIQGFYNTRMREDSELAEQLSEALGVHAQGFASAIENAPAWQPDWPSDAATGLFEAFYHPADPSQDRVPRFNAQ